MGLVDSPSRRWFDGWPSIRHAILVRPLLALVQVSTHPLNLSQAITVVCVACQGRIILKPATCRNRYKFLLASSLTRLWCAPDTPLRTVTPFSTNSSPFTRCDSYTFLILAIPQYLCLPTLISFALRSNTRVPAIRYATRPQFLLSFYVGQEDAFAKSTRDTATHFEFAGYNRNCIDYLSESLEILEYKP